MARPFIARPFIARPFMARPFIARPFMARPFMARPFMARPFMARPFMAPAIYGPGHLWPLSAPRERRFSGRRAQVKRKGAFSFRAGFVGSRNRRPPFWKRFYCFKTIIPQTRPLFQALRKKVRRKENAFRRISFCPYALRRAPQPLPPHTISPVRKTSRHRARRRPSARRACRFRRFFPPPSR